MTSPTRVLVPLDSQEVEAFQTALAYGDAICKKTDAADIILLTHTKHQLDHTSLSRFLGDRTVRALSKGPVSMQSGVRLHSETVRTMRTPSRNSVVIVYYAEIGILDLVDGFRNIAGVVAVPDVPREAAEWARRWGVLIHGKERQDAPELISDMTVVRALESLTMMVNLSTGLGHPRDKEYANETLRILRAKGHVDPTSQIKSWAIRKGWRPDDSAALETLSGKIWSLKNKPSLATFYNANERYARWRDGESR